MRLTADDRLDAAVKMDPKDPRHIRPTTSHVPKPTKEEAIARHQSRFT